MKVAQAVLRGALRAATRKMGACLSLSLFLHARITVALPMIAPEVPHRYAFLTDAAPADEGGHGCHVLAREWLAAMGDAAVLVVTHPPPWKVLARLMTHNGGRPVCSYRVAPRRLYARLPLLTLVLLACQLRRLARQVDASGATRLFALCGADFWYLASVWMIQKAVRRPMDLYLVDDLEASAQIQGRLSPRWFVRALEAHVLRRASRVYVISRGFAAHLNEKYSVSAQWLPISITDTPAPYHAHVSADPNIRTLVFAGAVNNLYASALKELLAQIQAWNLGRPPFRVRLQILSYTPVEEVHHWIGAAADLEVRVGLGAADLRRHLREGWAIFLPYSFEESERLMVSTSFSTKVTEALTSGRPILVYGPSYSSVPAYFLAEGLPLCFTSKIDLKRVFREIAAHDDPSLTERYAALVQRYHSPEAIRRILGSEHGTGENPG